MNQSVGEKLGCADEVFLSQVVTAYEADEETIGTETTLAVRGLKKTLQALRNSDYVNERETLVSIDDEFFSLDGLNYQYDETPGLDIGRSLTCRLERASRSNIVDFAIWYGKRISEIQLQLDADQPKLQADTLARTEALIMDDVLPKNALSVMRKSIDWAGPFTAIGSVEQAANSWSGHCSRDGIGIANLYSLPMFPDCISPTLRQTVFHEYTHAAGYIPGNRGLFEGLTERVSSKSYNRWFEEAYVSTISRAALQLDANESAMAQLPYPYTAERDFLNLTLQVAASPVALPDLSAAHFSGRSKRTAIRNYVAQALSSGLNDLFPEYEGNAWSGINESYETYSRRADRSEYIKLLHVVGQNRL